MAFASHVRIFIRLWLKAKGIKYIFVDKLVTKFKTPYLQSVYHYLGSEY
jgi:hypothetical protein